MDLKELRELANLTRKQVARKLNIDVSCVSHWELNDWAPPQKHWRKLAKMYGVTESDIKTIADAIRAASEQARAQRISHRQEIGGNIESDERVDN